MNQHPVLGSALVCLLVLSGCLSGPPSDGSSCHPTEESEVDPSFSMVETTAVPPDIAVRNTDTVHHNVTVRVENRSAVVFDETASLPPRSGEDPPEVVLEDFVREPGNYSITATVDGNVTDSATWDVGECYADTGRKTQWEVRVDDGPTVLVSREAGQ